MSRTPRFIPPDGALVEVTYRTIQGRFLLRPRQDLNALVVGVLARAQSFCPTVELIGIVALSNHIHLLLWVENQYQLSKLLHHFGGNTAREVNRLQDWKGSLWERRYTGICVTEEEAAQVKRLEYLLSQAVKDQLVKRVDQWPGIHFGRELLKGRSLLAGKWVDRTKKYRLEHKAKVESEGTGKKKQVRPDEYTTTLTVELKPLPCWRHLSPREYTRRIKELVKKVEAEAALERELRGIEVVGVEEICRRDPQTRPNRVKRSPAPLVHAATKKARWAWREGFSWFVAAYREAAELLKNGDRNAPFPEGCFPPGLPFVGDTGGLTPAPG